MPSGGELGEGGFGFLVFAGFGKRHRVFKSGAGLAGLLGLPPLIAAPGADAGDDQNADGNDEVAVALPQLLQPFAAYFFVNFLEYIGHEPSPQRSYYPRPLVRKKPRTRSLAGAGLSNRTVD